MAEDSKVRVLVKLHIAEVERLIKETERSLEVVTPDSIMNGYCVGRLESLRNELAFARMVLKEVQNNGD